MRGLIIAASLCMATTGLFAEPAQQNLQDASRVFSEVMATPDKGIPQDLLSDARCVVIIPGLKKAAFVVGGEYGKGIAECRKPGGGWGAPAAVKVEGGSVGFQIGGSSTDLILLVMSDHGMQSLLQDKFTLGADASVAAGPVGRTTSARTDVKLNAEILSWSRSKGVFAGVALNGATLRPDEKADRELYGHTMTNRQILTGNVPPPPAARPLIAELSRYSMHEAGRSVEQNPHR